MNISVHIRWRESKHPLVIIAILLITLIIGSRKLQSDSINNICDSGDIFIGRTHFVKEISENERRRIFSLCKKYAGPSAECNNLNRAINGTYDINVEAFYIDEYPVSIKEYLLYLNGDREKLPLRSKELLELENSKALDYPVVGINWHDATEFCEAHGKRLPSKEEYQAVMYNNNVLPSSYKELNVCFVKWRRQTIFNKFSLERYIEDIETECNIKPIGYSSFDEGKNGVRDIYANTSEWTSSYGTESSVERTKNEMSYEEYSDYMIVMGVWFRGKPHFLFTLYDGNVANKNDILNYTSFRCARDVVEN